MTIRIERIERIALLLAVSVYGSLGEAEQEELEAWKAESPDNLLLYQQLTDQKILSKKLKVYNSVDPEVYEAGLQKLLQMHKNLEKKTKQ